MHKLETPSAQNGLAAEDALVATPGAAEQALRIWLQTAPGQYLQHWQQVQFDEILPDIFGFHALQLGHPAWPALQASRISRHWRYSECAPQESNAPDVVGSFAALPFTERSIDLVLCLHALELSPDPHATLREIARILMPDGRLLITGFNPASLWGLRQRRAQFFRRVLGQRLALRLGLGQLFLPDTGEFIAYWRLRDWLRLLDFDIVDSRFGCYRFAVLQEQRFAKWAWMERWGERFASIFGASYTIVAVKRVPGARMLKAQWHQSERMVPAKTRTRVVSSSRQANKKNKQAICKSR